MLRCAVTAWYVLAAVLAPRACCCAFHPTAGAASPRTEAVAHLQVRTKRFPHCHTANEGAPSDRGDPKPTDRPGQPNCPCKGHHTHDAPAVLPAPAAQLFAGHDGPAAHPATHDFDWPPVPAFAAAPASGSRAGPFLTADDLLRAFHLLRC